MWVSALATRKDSHHLQRWGSLQKRKKRSLIRKFEDEKETFYEKG